MKDVSPIVILIGLFVILGLSYAPLKEVRKNDASNQQTRDATIGKNTNSLGYSPNKEIAEELKKTEKNIEELTKDLKEKKEESQRSPYYSKANMSNISGLSNSDPSKEYILISTNLKKGETINVTGWFLKSEVTGYYATIGRASLLPFPFTKNESEIVLQKGDRLYLTKGFSPIGVSFRTNKCTGFFEENRTFKPSLPRQCPRPKDEKLPQFSPIYDRNEECMDIIENIPRCTTRSASYFRDLSDSIPSSCKAYVTTQINYNSCVARHFSDTDFPGNQYRVYLNKFGPLWRPEREKINLHDKNGLIVDSIEY